MGSIPIACSINLKEIIIVSDFDRALQRPSNYKRLSSEQQWDIDKGLGILDWDGTCNHPPTHVSKCPECLKVWDRINVIKSVKLVIQKEAERAEIK